MLAIIIPYYKITYFEETLKSLANQTDKRFNVYIGDDASPDDCSKIIAKYASGLNICYHRFESNLGGRSLVKQWERCYEQIDTEEWVMFLGDDDTLSNNCVEEFYTNITEIEKCEVNIIRYSSIIINEASEHISHHYKFPTIEKTSTSYINKAKRKSRASLSEHIFRRSAYCKVGFIDMPEAWHTDDLIILEISNYSSIYTINNATAYIRYSNQSISGNQFNVEGKKRATLMFLLYLIGYKMNHFSKTERFYIIWYYFKKLKNYRKLSFGNSLFVIGILLKNLFNYKEFISQPIDLKVSTKP